MRSSPWNSLVPSLLDNFILFIWSFNRSLSIDKILASWVAFLNFVNHSTSFYIYLLLVIINILNKLKIREETTMSSWTSFNLKFYAMLMISVANLGYEKLLNHTDELNNCCAEKCEKSKDTKEKLTLKIIIVPTVE